MIDNPLSSQFQQDLEPLLEVIAIIYELELMPAIKIEMDKYKKAFLQANSSKAAFNEMLKTSIARCLELLSIHYRNKILNLYFTEEGLGLFILKNLSSLCNEFIRTGEF